MVLFLVLDVRQHHFKDAIGLATLQDGLILRLFLMLSLLVLCVEFDLFEEALRVSPLQYGYNFDFCKLGEALEHPSEGKAAGVRPVLEMILGFFDLNLLKRGIFLEKISEMSQSLVSYDTNIQLDDVFVQIGCLDHSHESNALETYLAKRHL